jgi:uncharacterized protein YktA (UPF0223 family)
MNKIELKEVIAETVKETILALKSENFFNDTKKTPVTSKSAYAKTETLLYNYNGFKRIVQDKMQEIADLRKYGVPQKSSMSGGERVQSSRNVQGIVLQEESVEQAVRSVEASVQGTVAAINLIDKCMATLKRDPYYDVLEMRYFEGRTLEDIGVYFGCDHTTISRNKNRLVKELAMRIFPDDAISEMMN